MFKGFLAGLLGAIAFLVAYFIGRVPFLWSVIVGGLVYIAFSLIMTRSKMAEVPEVEGMSPKDVIETLDEGERKVKNLRKLAGQIGRRRIARRVEDIANVADRILQELHEDPKDIRVARRFLNYYLDATVLVVDRYTSLDSKKTDSENVQEVLHNFEELLDTIEATFEKQYDRLLRNDVLDLDTDMTVLKQMMEMEGL
jgi:5-bromo-4-chloroindolyl phosphate hydrolysis protein